MTAILIVFRIFINITGKFSTREVEIHVLSPKVAKHHLRINYVVGKHNLLYINHISSDLEGHQVQYRGLRFGTIS